MALGTKATMGPKIARMVAASDILKWRANLKMKKDRNAQLGKNSRNKSLRVMRELMKEVNISGHRSKHMSEFLDKKIDTVITVCGNADQACPMFRDRWNRYHWGFDDPAHATGTDAEILAVFRQVRN